MLRPLTGPQNGKEGKILGKDYTFAMTPIKAGKPEVFGKNISFRGEGCYDGVKMSIIGLDYFR